MKRPIVIALAAGLAVFFAVYASTTRRTKLQGKSVSFWVAQAAGPTETERQEAIDILRQDLPAVMPVLEKQLRNRDSRFHRWWLRLQGLPGISPPDPAAWGHRRAAQVIVGLGHSTDAATQSLIKLFAEGLPENSGLFAQALCQIGPKAVPPLQEGLAHSHPLIRRGCLLALLCLGPDAEKSLPLVELLVHDPNPAIRSASARFVGQFPAKSLDSVPALASLLLDSHLAVQQAAAASLAEFGPAAAPALPQLIQALQDSPASVTVDVANAIGRIGPPAAPAVAPLAGLFPTSHSIVQIALAKALGRIGTNATPAVPILVEGLSHSDSFVRSQCAIALGQIGPSAQQAVDALEKGLTDVDLGMRACCAQALGRIGPPARRAIPALITALNNDHSGMMPYVPAAIRQIEPDGDYHFIVE